MHVGVAFTTHTHFGQWPLYIAGYTDIHESLEKGLAQGDIETNSAEHTSNQEVKYIYCTTCRYCL